MMDWLANHILYVGLPDHPVSLSAVSECSQYDSFLPSILVCLSQVLVGREKWHSVQDSCGGQLEWSLSCMEEVGEKTE